MSLNQQQILHSMAMGQLTMVAPELGETYVGKSVNMFGLLALMLAGGQDRMLQAAPRIREELEALLASAETGNPAMQAELADALSDECGNSWIARQNRLLEALERLHAHADSGAPALAARCRAFLLEMAEAEQMEMPSLPA